MNPRTFMDIEIDGAYVGRIVFELFADIAPKTVENFRCLCTGLRGISKMSGKKLTYRDNRFHRVVKDFMIQGGDITEGDGTGGESIYGFNFPDETFRLRHDQPFLLSMANCGPNTNGSQFFIATVPCPHLDGENVVFGRVVHGIEVVKEIENNPVDSNYRPVGEIRIIHCGELEYIVTEEILLSTSTVVPSKKALREKMKIERKRMESESKRKIMEKPTERKR